MENQCTCTANGTERNETKRKRVIEFGNSNEKKRTKCQCYKIYSMLCVCDCEQQNTSYLSTRANTCPHPSHYGHTLRTDELLFAMLLLCSYFFCCPLTRLAPTNFLTMLRKFANQDNGLNLCCSRVYNKSLLTFSRILCAQHTQNRDFCFPLLIFPLLQKNHGYMKNERERE